MLQRSILPALLLVCFGSLLPLSSVSLSAQQPEPLKPARVDVIVYGGTPGGITAVRAYLRGRNFDAVCSQTPEADIYIYIDVVGSEGILARAGHRLIGSLKQVCMIIIYFEASSFAIPIQHSGPIPNCRT